MGVKKYQTKQGVRYLAQLEDGKSKGGFKDKAEAWQWLKVAKSQAATPVKTAMGFDDMAVAYLDETMDRKQKNTYYVKRGSIRRWAAFDESCALVPSKDTIREFLRLQKEERGAKASNRDLRELKALYNWGVRYDYVQSNPFRSFEPYAEDQYIRYVPPAEDVAAARMAATQDQRDVIDTLYFTAARMGELFRLTWDDVNMEAGTIRLWTRKRKGGALESRTIAMITDLKAVMKRRWQERDPHCPWVFPNKEGGQGSKLQGFYKWLFHDVCARAGVPLFTAHCLRHHVATLFKDSEKASVRQIQQFLGHKRLDTTERYLHDMDVDRGILAAFGGASGNGAGNEAIPVTKKGSR